MNVYEGVFSPDGKWLVTFGEKGTFLNLWEIPGFALKATLSGTQWSTF